MLKNTCIFLYGQGQRKLKISVRRPVGAGVAARLSLSLRTHRYVLSIDSCGTLVSCSRPKGIRGDSWNVRGVFLVLYGCHSFCLKQSSPQSCSSELPEALCNQSLAHRTFIILRVCYRALSSEAGWKDAADIGTYSLLGWCCGTFILSWCTQKWPICCPTKVC